MTLSLQEKFRAELNEKQFEAVCYDDGPSLVVAGAGSGKTRVLTYKIAWLIANGVEPWRILALTFTNKAAREMNGRIAAICDAKSANAVWSGTFHSLFSRILRIESEAVGIPHDFTIYDSSNTLSAIKKIVKDLGLDDKAYKASAIAGRISKAKNLLQLPADYAADKDNLDRDRRNGVGELWRIYQMYQDRLRVANALDFDDILLFTHRLLFQNEEVRNKYRERFSRILVDEYQDTNMAQLQILRLLTTPESRICVVGDDAQSIYGFRGADITGILNFTKHYPKAHTVKLECNYRSTSTIVEAANSVIRHNREQIFKQVYAAAPGEGNKIKLIKADSDKDEARLVLQEVERLHFREHVEYPEVAILYRTNAQSRSLEEACRRNGIPYKIYGGMSFYGRKEIKDVLAYLSLVCNPDDDEAFLRVVNLPARGIGATTINRLRAHAIEQSSSLWQALNGAAAIPSLSNAAMKKLLDFRDLIASFREKISETSAYQLTVQILEQSGMTAMFAADKTPEGQAAKDNINEFLSSVYSKELEVQQTEGGTLRLMDFMSYVSLLTTTDEEGDADAAHINLMTIHASKGLEFDAVFITGMEDDLFPSSSARLYPKELEEERRLFYVALTRARKFCILTHASNRYVYGHMEMANPSPFLDEVDPRYIERAGSRSDLFRTPASLFGGTNDFAARYRQKASPQPSFPKSRFTPLGSRPLQQSPAPSPQTAQTACGVKPGSVIVHERFGRGTVVGIDGVGDSTKIHVHFEASGDKKLLVKFARFQVIS